MSFVLSPVSIALELATARKSRARETVTLEDGALRTIRRRQNQINSTYYSTGQAEKEKPSSCTNTVSKRHLLRKQILLWCLGHKRENKRMDEPPTLSYQHQQILRYIELRAQWEGRITANHIVESFNISRDSASKLIKRYNEILPNNLSYDASAKGHTPTEKFTPEYSTGSLEEYIYSFIQTDLPENQTGFVLHDTFPMRQFGRALQPEIVRPMLHSINNKRKIDISYRSMSSPEVEGRIISPHSLIHDGMRWHVRARCEKNQEYRDFVISRISEVIDDEGPAEYGIEEDDDWNTWITLTIQPDIRLSRIKQQVVAQDYSMTENKEGRYQCEYRMRAAFSIYTLRHLGLDRLREKAEAQQIMLTPECQSDIEKYTS
jgi:hypothetical protein